MAELQKLKNEVSGSDQAAFFDLILVYDSHSLR